jgi:hypothetical protein
MVVNHGAKKDMCHVGEIQFRLCGKYLFSDVADIFGVPLFITTRSELTAAACFEENSMRLIVWSNASYT